MHAEIAGFTEKLIIDHACTALDHSNAGCIVAFNVITDKFADLKLIGLSIGEEVVCAHNCWYILINLVCEPHTKESSDFVARIHGDNQHSLYQR